MSKTSGVGSYLFVNQYDLSGDVGALSSLTASRNLQDISTLQRSYIERLPLLRDGSLTYAAFFNAAAGGSHAVLNNLNGADSLFSWLSSSSLGAVSASLQARQADYGITRGADGSLALSPSAQADGYGVEFANSLTTGKQTFASAAGGTAIDDYTPGFTATSTSFGLAAYLHAISIGSGTATVAVQDSADNVSFANVTGGVFTAVSAATKERIQTATNQSVRRYLRVNVSGTFTNLVCAVTVVRYHTDPSIG